MSDLDRRLAAVERALTDGRAPADLPDAAATADHLEALDDRLDDLEGRLADVEGSVEAVRGYVGERRRVDAEAERTARAAMAAVEELESRLGSDRRPRAPSTGAPLVARASQPEPERTVGLLGRLRARLW